MSRSRLAVAATTLVLFLGACGGSSSSDGDSSATQGAESEGDTAKKVSGVCAAIQDLGPRLAGEESFTEDNINDLMSTLDDIKAAADDSVDEQVDIAMGYFKQLDDVLSKFDYDIMAASEDAEAISVLTNLSESEEMTAAGAAIDVWTQDNCGATLGGE